MGALCNGILAGLAPLLQKLCACKKGQGRGGGGVSSDLLLGPWERLFQFVLRPVQSIWRDQRRFPQFTRRLLGSRRLVRKIPAETSDFRVWRWDTGQRLLGSRVPQTSETRMNFGRGSPCKERPFGSLQLLRDTVNSLFFVCFFYIKRIHSHAYAW